MLLHVARANSVTSVAEPGTWFESPSHITSHPGGKEKTNRLAGGGADRPLAAPLHRDVCFISFNGGSYH